MTPKIFKISATFSGAHFTAMRHSKPCCFISLRINVKAQQEITAHTFEFNSKQLLFTMLGFHCFCIHKLMIGKFSGDILQCYFTAVKMFSYVGKF